MKKAHKVMFKFVAVFALLVVLFWGCSDEMNKTGYDLLLSGDVVSAHKIAIARADITAYTATDELVKTSNPALSLLGTFNDPIFGKSTTDFAYQFRLINYVDFSALKNVKPDSLVLTLIYKETYGDRVTPQSLKVYELNEELNPDAIYYQGIDLKSKSNSEVVAEQTFVPKFKLIFLTSKYNSLSNPTPKDTLPQKIKFHLSNSLLQKLIAFKAPPADSLKGKSINDVFLQYFKGLYVEAGDLNQGGSIVKIVPRAEDADSTIIYTEMKLYYHHLLHINDKDIDTAMVASYVVNSTSARVGHFDHYNYSTAQFATNKVQGDTPDSLMYLQTTGGLSNKIYIPSLNNWTDSAGCAINKAELIFTVDESTVDTILTPAPKKIILSLIDSNGGITEINAITKKPSLIFPTDLKLSEAYYGGTYNKPDKKTIGTYQFNLAKHLQEIIKGKGKFKNYGFYLSTDDKNAIFRRLVLKGATSKVGIRFEITYTKIKK